MKKGIMSSFIILGVLLSGCGSQKEELYSSSNPVDITVWTYYNGDQLSSSSLKYLFKSTIPCI